MYHIKSNKIFMIIIGGLLLFLITACTQSNITDAKKSEQLKQKQVNLQENNNNLNHEQNSEGQITGNALTINGQEIDAEDYNRRLFKARFVQAAQGVDYEGTNREEAYKMLKQHTIEQLIRETVIMQEAKNNDVSVSELEVEQVLETIKSRFPSEDDFKTTMQSRGLDENTIKAYNRLQMTSVNLMQKLGGQQQFDEYINTKISKAQVEVNDKLIDKLLFDLSKSSAIPLDKQSRL